MRVKCESSAAHLLMSRRSEAEYDMMLIEHQAAELTDTLHLDQDGRGAAARSEPTPCGAIAAAGGRCRAHREAMLARLARGVYRI